MRRLQQLTGRFHLPPPSVAPGVALHSHAAHCARLNGIPEDVVRRAQHVTDLASRQEWTTLGLEGLMAEIGLLDDDDNTTTTGQTTETGEDGSDRAAKRPRLPSASGSRQGSAQPQDRDQYEHEARRRQRAEREEAMHHRLQEAQARIGRFLQWDLETLVLELEIEEDEKKKRQSKGKVIEDGTGDEAWTKLQAQLLQVLAGSSTKRER